MGSYNNLSKNEIIRSLKKKNIAYSPGSSKEKLIKLLAKTEKSAVKKKASQVKKIKTAAKPKAGIKKKAAKPAKPAKISVSSKVKEPGLKSSASAPSGSYIKDEIEKYHSLPDFKLLKNLQFDIPESYNFHKLGLLVMDPYWLYSYWEIRKDVIDDLIKKYSRDVINKNNLFINVCRVQDMNESPDNAVFLGEIKVNSFKGNWFINTNKPESMFLIRLGFKDKNNDFIKVLTSNLVKAPRDKMSENLSQNWLYCDMDKPLSFQPILCFKSPIKYPWDIDRLSLVSSISNLERGLLANAIFGSDSFIKKL